MSEGGGPISELPTIPKQFCSVEVRQMLACCLRVLLGTRVGAMSTPGHRRPTAPTLRSIPQEYVRVFEPLLLEECAAQMLRGQEEGQVLTSQVSALSACCCGVVTVASSLDGLSIEHHAGRQAGRQANRRLLPTSLVPPPPRCPCHPLVHSTTCAARSGGGRQRSPRGGVGGCAPHVAPRRQQHLPRK
jgi:hypothetical protein